MRLRYSQSIPKSERGAAMLAALCLAMVFALCLSSYVALCYTSLRMSNRNMMNSHCVELAEAGLEQALYVENWNAALWQSPQMPPTSSQPMVLTGFTFENGATGTINISVSGPASAPIITSEAFVTLSDGVTVIKRALRAQCAYAAPTSFQNTVGTTSGLIKFTAGGTIDSYDSSLGNYGAVIGAGPAVNTGYSAILLSQYVSPLPPETPNQAGVVLTTAKVSGYVIGVSPNPASYSAGAQIVGPNTPSGEMIDPSRVLTNAQISIPQFVENVPSSATAVAVNLSGNQTMSLGNPNATVATPYYIFGDLTLSNSSVLSINGPVVLVVYGNVSITDSAQISIASTNITAGGPNVSLEMHVGYGNMNIDGGGIVNNTLSPERLLIMSTWNQSGVLEMNTTTPFYGVIDFPSDSFTVNSTSQQIYGALLASSITFTGTPAIHYDLHLQAQNSMIGSSPGFMSPIFNAFQATGGSETNVTQPLTVSSVIEVAAL